jgi:hypothetical protein
LPTTTTTTAAINEEDFKYILSLFEPPVTPRRYSCRKTEDQQWVADSLDKMLADFAESDFINCKVNMYNYLGKWRKFSAPSLNSEIIAPIVLNSSNGNGHFHKDYHYDIALDLYTATPIPFAERIEEAAKLIQVKAIAEQAPICLFIDLDHRPALPRTRKRIKDVFMDDELEPTVLDSGNGFQVLLPIETDPTKYAVPMDYETKDDLIPGRTLDSARSFALAYSNPANVSPGSELLRCAADVLSCNKSDDGNNPSVRSCMVRAPGSYNGKLIAKGITDKPVSIVQRGSWEQGKKGHIMYLLPYLDAHIKKEKLKRAKMLTDARNKRLKRERNLQAFENAGSGYYYNQKSRAEILQLHYWYIEMFMRTPVDDFRKRGAALLLAPYLMRIKCLPYELAEKIILQWLSACDRVKMLDFDAADKTAQALDYAISSNYLPLEFHNIPNHDPKTHARLARLRANYYFSNNMIQRNVPPPPPLPPSSTLVGGN